MAKKTRGKYLTAKSIKREAENCLEELMSDERLQQICKTAQDEIAALEQEEVALIPERDHILRQVNTKREMIMSMVSEKIEVPQTMLDSLSLLETEYRVKAGRCSTIARRTEQLEDIIERAKSDLSIKLHSYWHLLKTVGLIKEDWVSFSAPYRDKII